jgi:hypothetical protein
MSETTPLERVSQRLVDAHFKRVATPLTIGGLEIDAPAAFIGSPPSPDLVVVGDTIEQTPPRLQQTVEGIGRALDMMGSRRPLTLVVVGPRPTSAAITALSRFARVLPVGDAADETNLANWLAVLLPLRLPVMSDDRAAAALDAVIEGTRDPIEAEFVALASMGSEAVADRLAAYVDEPFEPLDGDSGMELP